MEKETSITKEDIKIYHVLCTDYVLENLRLYVFAGRLKHDVDVYGDENPLCWIDADDDFFDITHYAGDGNLGHILICANYHKEKIF